MVFPSPAQARMSRRDCLALASAFAVSGLSAGAAGAVPSADLHIEVAARARRLAGGPATLRMLAPEGSGANTEPVVAVFTALTGITVERREVPVDEITAQLTLDSFGGAADYDLGLPATFGIPDLAAGQIIRPLTEFARRHEPQGFRDELLYATGDSFDGEIYGFQTDGDTYVMFYHKDWLEDPDEAARYADRHGRPLAVPDSWAELDAQMAFFHRPDQDRYGGALFRTPGYLAWEWWMRFHAKGVWPLSEDLEPQIAGDAGVAALEEMIAATETLYPHARSAGLFENWAQYGRGNIFCNIGWGGSQKYLNSAKSRMRGRMLFSQAPSAEIAGESVRMAYFNWGWNYVVTASSKQPELAYLFALFASTSHVSTLSVREQGGYFDPFRPEHYEDEVIRRIYSPEFLSVHRASMRHAIPDLYLAQQGEYLRALSEGLDAALRNDVAPDTALERVARQWSLLNLRVGHTQQRDRWAALRAKYPPAARAVLRDLA